MVAVEQAKTEKQFDIDKALNTAGFGEFLARYPDADSFEPSEDNIAEMEIRFNAFTKKNKTSKEFKKLYNDEIFKGAEVKITEEEFAKIGIDEYFEDLAINDPEQVEKYFNQIKEYHDTQKRVTDKEAELAKHMGAGTVDQLRVKLETVKGTQWGSKKALPFIGYFFRTSDENSARREIVANHGITLSEVAEKLKQVQDKEEALKSFNELREEFFVNFSKAGEVCSLAQQKAQWRLGQMIDPTMPLKLGELDKGREYYEKLMGDGRGFSIDYLEGFEQDRIDIVLQQAIEAKVIEAIRQTIDNTVLGSTPLANLEKALKKITEREVVGATKKGFAKVFIKDSLENAMSKTGDIARKIYLKRILFKFS
jgi:hypothetical protein